MEWTLKAARAAKDMTAAELAKEVGCTPATISNIENGSHASPKYIKAILDTLGLEGEQRRQVAVSVMPDAYVQEVSNG